MPTLCAMLLYEACALNHGSDLALFREDMRCNVANCLAGASLRLWLYRRRGHHVET